MFNTRILFSLFLFVPAGVLAQATTTAAIPPWQTGIITEDGTCGRGTPGWVCTPTWGACCSKDSRCGRSVAFCGEGCQPGFGNCNAPPPPVAGPGSPSPDGSCGGTAQFNCTGTTFGDCCSSSGFCGATPAHCGVGCQPGFGTCADTGNITTDGQCGTNGKVCTGSEYGDCCSSSGFCGQTAGHCGAGCQAGFGTCSGPSGGGNVSTDGQCGATGNMKTCLTSEFGDCCSSSGFCGATTAHCGAGCQAPFGNCSNGAGDISTDGKCGIANGGKVCRGSGFGDCCSSSGFCGSTPQFCGAGCQTGFGNCTAAAGNITTDGACGGNNGKTCTGSGFGNCCSASGFCGNTTDHCTAGCQPGFGACEGPGNVSTDGRCGSNGKTCAGSTFGNCCSSGGFCGTTSDHCGAGCQAGFGTCSSGSGSISTDGKCSTNGKTCTGSTFGNCCSSDNFCGTTSQHCGAGCQARFGTCGSGSGNISTDGKCGSNGKTCIGSTFGTCCSASGFCGSTTQHCGAGCQSGFGTCGSGSGSISTDGKCGANGKTCVGSPFGSCCSGAGFCGSTANHCGQGCQRSFSNSCITTNVPSVDGSCGASKGGFTCSGGDFNNQCCSAGGFCGTTSGHCGSGCQRGYGRCN
ncbi:hypothetical protein V8F20_007276 [Naviculisporaceae sp. PSN 640]